MDSGIERGYVSDKTIAGGWTKAFLFVARSVAIHKRKKGKFRKSFVTNGNKKRLGIFNQMLISKLPNQATRFNVK